METYRLYRLRDGRITDVVVLAADTDEEARTGAAAHFVGASKELWRGAHLVAALPPSSAREGDER